MELTYHAIFKATLCCFQASLAVLTRQLCEFINHEYVESYATSTDALPLQSVSAVIMASHFNPAEVELGFVDASSKDDILIPFLVISRDDFMTVSRLLDADGSLRVRVDDTGRDVALQFYSNSGIITLLVLLVIAAVVNAILAGLTFVKVWRRQEKHILALSCLAIEFLASLSTSSHLPYHC